jgi:TrmH family RNA methyltransferase
VASPDLLTPRSERVKQARKLQRRASRMSARRFLAEGPQAVREALGAPDCVREVFATAEASERHADLVATASAQGVGWNRVDDAALGSLAETVAPQGLVAVCSFVDVPLDAVVENRPTLVAVCVDIRDPGNAGSVLRCADAAGADAVVLAGTSVDPYNGKTVRTSVGSLFHLPVVFGASVADTVAVLRAAGLQVIATDGGGKSLDDVADQGLLARPTAWLFGNEAHGLADAHAALADRVVGVPLYGRAESLNLATAAAICLYATARAQRGRPSGLASDGAEGRSAPTPGASLP